MHQSFKDALVARLGSHQGAHQSHGFEVLELSLQTDEKKARAPERPNFHFTSTSASKAEVLERLLERGFATCDVCRRVFWEGSHWRRMRTLLAPVMGREI